MDLFDGFTSHFLLFMFVFLFLHHCYPLGIIWDIWEDNGFVSVMWLFQSTALSTLPPLFSSSYIFKTNGRIFYLYQEIYLFLFIWKQVSFPVRSTVSHQSQHCIHSNCMHNVILYVIVRRIVQGTEGEHILQPC